MKTPGAAIRETMDEIKNLTDDVEHIKETLAEAQATLGFQQVVIASLTAENKRLLKRLQWKKAADEPPKRGGQYLVLCQLQYPDSTVSEMYEDMEYDEVRGFITRERVVPLYWNDLPETEEDKKYAR